MITITRNEELVLNQINVLNAKYDDKILFDELKNELSFKEYNLVQILNSLASKELIDFIDNVIYFVDSDKEINIVNSKKDVEEIELNQKEKSSFELIKNIVDEKNLVSKYILEGHLLYGDLKLTNFRMYHILLSLENKGLLKRIKKDDGEYYLLIN